MEKKKAFEQKMTSIEMAEITHQKHKDVMKEIKKLEPEWVKEHGNGFELVKFKDENGQRVALYFYNKVGSTLQRDAGVCDSECG